MDEPLGALDKNLREEMQYEIKHIHESPVFQCLRDARPIRSADDVEPDRGLDDGIVQQLAAPDVLYEKPENAFVAQFTARITS